MARTKHKKSAVKTNKKTASLKKLVTKPKASIKKAKKKITKSKSTKPKKVNYLPQGYNNITPYLTVDRAADAIAFYKKIFGAKEVMRMEQTGGKIVHAELNLGD